ncbi:flagellar basal body P-ring formation chaperone FlgA [Paracoccus ravus]|uniref:flagellar basal body P-ring formation chaperone FlgA n=1 Tax=Paracoccus ravus TaxID=2447760 RepID=UPI00106EB7D4|nr:flagellar basal body P-ring formation chaperone FlgA [Paracoccus ravus]
MKALVRATALAGFALAGPGFAEVGSIFDAYRTEQPLRLEEPVANFVQDEVYAAIAAMPLLPSDVEIAIELDAGPQAHAIRLDRFAFNTRSGRFSALAVSGSGTATAIHGQARLTVPTLMPSRRIAAGEIISEADLALFSIPLSAANIHVLRHGEDILGREAKRNLLPERPIDAQSLTEPRAVRRGMAVTISHLDRGLTLSATGKALQDGAIGDVIRVVNTHSSKTVYGEITGDGKVRTLAVPPAVQ